MPPRRRKKREAPVEDTPAAPTVEAEVLPPEPSRPPSAGVRATASTSIELEASITGQAAAVRDVMHRQLTDGAEAAQRVFAEGQNDNVLKVLDTVVSGIKNGTDISANQEEISKLILNQESRAELIDNILLTHDYDRLVKYVRARKVLEDFLLLSCQRGDLSATEALAFMKIVMSESETLQNRIKAGATSVKDILGLVNKADFALQVKETELSKKFEKTSPQGREIIRRLAHRLNKVQKGANKQSIPDK